MARLSRLAWAVAAVVLGLGVLAAGLEAMGYDAAPALGALWSGAFGSWYAFTSTTLVRAVPLILDRPGHSHRLSGRRAQHRRRRSVLRWSDRSYLGGVAMAAARPAPVAIVAVLLAAALAGALWVALPVWLKLRFGVIEVISTLLLVFVAELLVSLMVQGPLQERGHIYPQSDAIPEFCPASLDRRHPAARRVSLALVLGATLWFVFSRTWWGFKLRAVGLGPRAAEVSGRIDSQRVGAAALFLPAPWRALPAESR